MRMSSILDSRQLLAVVVLSRTGSFTRAGKELFLTQSAVSHAIKALENDLKCVLFTRTPRGVTLTAIGREFLPHAEKILGNMVAARETISAFQGAPADVSSGAVRTGGPTIKIMVATGGAPPPSMLPFA